MTTAWISGRKEATTIPSVSISIWVQAQGSSGTAGSEHQPPGAGWGEGMGTLQSEEDSHEKQAQRSAGMVCASVNAMTRRVAFIAFQYSPKFADLQRRGGLKSLNRSRHGPIMWWMHERCISASGSSVVE